jgi:regulator of RNase E activity RraA
MLGIQQFTVPGVKFAGPAVTVRGIVHRGSVTKSSGFKYILEAREAARQRGPGCVMIYSTYEADALALGSCMGTGLAQAGIIAAVTDSGVRDIEGLREINFPVWAKQICARSAGMGRVEEVGAMEPVQCNGVQVRPGDIVVADESGVCVVPQEVAEEAIERVKEGAKRESFLLSQMTDKKVDYPEAIKSLASHGGVPEWFDK